MSNQTLSFKVLSTLSKERGVYGLRNGDYERYRRHCSNKLHRLRQVTGLSCGKGKTFKKPPAITKESVKDVKQLQVLLFSAERALAHSHGFRSLKTKPNPPPNVKKEQISWLRRALKYSTELYDIALALSKDSAGIDQRTLAEIAIYHLSIRSELSFEKSAWEAALTDLAARRKLLSTLSDAARDSYDQALAVEFIDGHDPLIRFAAYKLGHKESHDIEGVVKDIDNEMMEEAFPGIGQLVEGLRGETNVEEMEKGRKELENVTFAGDQIELRSAEIVNVMLRVQEALGKVQGKKSDGVKAGGMRGWDRVLAVLGEAESIARRLLDDHEASSAGSSLRSAKTSQSLSVAHQYIVYLLLSNRIKRDLLLVDTLQTSSTVLPSDPTTFKVAGGKVKLGQAVKHLTAVIKLYDTVLQSMSQLRSLAIVEEKDGVRTMADGLEAYFHASRCYNLARLHCIHPTPSFASAVQLLERGSGLTSQAKSSLFELSISLEEEIISVDRFDVDTLAQQVDKLTLASKRALFAERIPKPVFFDTAFNYIDLPMDELLVLAGKQEAKPKVTEAPVQAVANVAEKVIPGAGQAVKSAANAVKSRTTRETTPAVEEPVEEKPKGWLGGWFGRK